MPKRQNISTRILHQIFFFRFACIGHCWSMSKTNSQTAKRKKFRTNIVKRQTTQNERQIFIFWIIPFVAVTTDRSLARPTQRCTKRMDTFPFGRCVHMYYVCVWNAMLSKQGEKMIFFSLFFSISFERRSDILLWVCSIFIRVQESILFFICACVLIWVLHIILYNLI